VLPSAIILKAFELSILSQGFDWLGGGDLFAWRGGRGFDSPHYRIFCCFILNAGWRRLSARWDRAVSSVGPGFGLTVGPICKICWLDPSIRSVGGTLLSALLAGPFFQLCWTRCSRICNW
jgi:hypothetical protein